ncbi:MAG: hypothetical protein ABSD38_27800 [Syntrophorhabdales bacterium]|jgi:hypothetical protein
MKKLIVLSLIMAGMVLMAGFSTPTWAQSPVNDLKPTFMSPTPGLYVNGWPAFTVSYPKEWVEGPVGGPGAVFEAGAARPDLPPGNYLPSLTIVVFPSPLPLEDWAKLFMPVWVELMTDIKVLSDKPSQLKDGTPAREVEYEGVAKNGPKNNCLLLATKKDLMWLNIILTDDKAKIGEDLKRIAYSLTFQPGREEPVQVPPGVRAFFDMYCVDMGSHDVKTIMAHFSDRFLNSGASKAYLEQAWRNDPLSPIQRPPTSCEATVTVFEPRGDKAYIDGFFLSKAKGDANALKTPMYFQQIINEHGEWKWYGNQK